MTEHKILIKTTPTPGDSRFYERWLEIGALTDQQEQATVLVVDFRHVVNEELLRRMPRLEFIASPTTGLTHIQCELPPRIRLVSLKGETAFLSEVKSVSEFVMRMILTISRPVDGEFGHLLSGKTIGIVGLGRIGRQVSVLASAFGMHTYGVDRDSPDWAWSLLLQKSDFISVHVPEQADTYHLINKEMMLKMKRSAILINTSRPSVVDEDGLAEVLLDGRLAGAGLDVTDRSWVGFPMVLQTPHVAGHTIEDRIKTDEYISELVKKALGPRRVRELH